MDNNLKRRPFAVASSSNEEVQQAMQKELKVHCALVSNDLIVNFSLSMN